MMREVCLILIFVFFPIVSMATTPERFVGICNTNETVFSNQSIQSFQSMMSALWINKKLTARSGRELNFTARNINVENGVITFHHPLIENRGIKDATLRCRETGRNFLGFETCQQYEEYALGNILCAELGYGPYIQTESARISNNTYTSIFVAGDLENSTWDTMRTSSLIAPRFYVYVINSFSCQIR